MAFRFYNIFGISLGLLLAAVSFMLAAVIDGVRKEKERLTAAPMSRYDHKIETSLEGIENLSKEKKEK